MSYKKVAYDYIKNKIYERQLYPGSLVNTTHLSKELKMSRTPVINALQRLEAEGYVETNKNKQLVVTDKVEFRENRKYLYSHIYFLADLVKNIIDYIEEYHINVDFDEANSLIEKAFSVTQDKKGDFKSFYQEEKAVFSYLFSKHENPCYLMCGMELLENIHAIFYEDFEFTKFIDVTLKYYQRIFDKLSKKEFVGAKEDVDRLADILCKNHKASIRGLDH